MKDDKKYNDGDEMSPTGLGLISFFFDVCKTSSSKTTQLF